MADTTDPAWAEKVKQYESKLAALNAINSALQKENDKFRKQIKRAARPPTEAEEELLELREEFTERLGVADRTIETLKEEKLRLQQQLQQATAGGSATEAKIRELEDVVTGLREEGEALAKKNGDMESTLRKLRSTSRDVESERDKLQQRVKVLETQLLELQEKAEKDAHNATAQIEELEAELKEARLDAKKQVAEARREAQDALMKYESEAAKGGEALLASAREREQTLVASLAEVRASMEAMANELGTKEDNYRRQVSKLEERIWTLEQEKEALSSSSSESSKPLLKQIESMAAAAAAAQAASEEAERKLTHKLRAAEEAAASARDTERSAISRAAAAEAAAGAAREAAAQASASAAELKAKLEAEKRHGATLDAEKRSAAERLAASLAREEKYKQEAETYRRDVHEKLWDAEQRVRTLVAEREEMMQRLEAQSSLASQRARSGEAGASSSKVESMTTPATVPQAVHEEALENGADDDELDRLLSSLASEQSNGGSSSIVPSFFSGKPKLDAAKYQRTIELLQTRVRAAEKARDEAGEQLCKAMQTADEAARLASSARELQVQQQEAQKKVDIVLELLGERNERVEQLEEDIHDMKRIFHEQLMECVEQLNRAQAEIARLKAALQS